MRRTSGPSRVRLAESAHWRSSNAISSGRPSLTRSNAPSAASRSAPPGAAPSSPTASCSMPSGRVAVNSSALVRTTTVPAASARAHAVSISVDLPIPASPSITSTPPVGSASTSARTAATSDSRPTMRARPAVVAPIVGAYREQVTRSGVEETECPHRSSTLRRTTDSPPRGRPYRPMHGNLR